MLLDTSVCIDLMREAGSRTSGPAHNALRRLEDTPLSISMFSVCELNTGAVLSDQDGLERRRIADLVKRLTVLYPDTGFPVLYGEAAAALLSAGTPIPVMDLLIGVTAKMWGLPVLTRDIRHFERIPGLIVEGY